MVRGAQMAMRKVCLRRSNASDSLSIPPWEARLRIPNVPVTSIPCWRWPLRRACRLSAAGRRAARPQERSLDIKPLWRISGPGADQCRRFGVHQFLFHGRRQDHLVKQRREDIDMTDQEQIVDRSGVGDDQPHLLKSQSLKSLDVAMQVLDSEVVDQDAIGFQESIQSVTGAETRQFL